jgi:Putative DNA-binding domain
MPEPSTFLDVLLKSLRSAANYSPAEESPPAAILWPDAERDWEGLLPRLRSHLPLLTLGPYDALERTGPAAWIRCMISRTLPKRLAPNAIPVIYLPGVSASMLNDSSQRGRAMKPLAELRYRSVVWTCRDGAEWTVASFFQDSQDGLGIEMRDSDYTRRAMRRFLPVLCGLTLAQLSEEQPWKARDFEALVGNSVDILVGMGENSDLEFKSTGRWDLKLLKENPLLEQVIVKSIGGFLNSQRGGTLLIGVEDKGQICGIEHDFQTFSKEKDRNEDGYERWLMTLLLSTYSQEFTSTIHPSFHLVDGRTICKVDVDPAPWPAIAKFKGKDGQDQEVFYLRTGNSTNAMGLRAFVTYYRTRWPNR